MEHIEGLPEGPLAIYSPSDDPDDRVLAVISEEFGESANLIVPQINERIHRISGTLIVKATKGDGAGTYRPYDPIPEASFVQANSDTPTDETKGEGAGTIPPVEETNQAPVEETNQPQAETPVVAQPGEQGK
jgi:hypothetical protein